MTGKSPQVSFPILFVSLNTTKATRSSALCVSVAITDLHIVNTGDRNHSENGGVH